MITVKGSTKRGQKLLAIGENVQGARLEDVYGSYSNAKYVAWKNCLVEFRECNESAWGFAICSHNAQFFSVSWFTTTGMHLITPYNHYFVTLPDEQN
jgi:hypothetical protein